MSRVADATLRNNGTVAELRAQVQVLLERSLFFERPRSLTQESP